MSEPAAPQLNMVVFYYSIQMKPKSGDILGNLLDIILDIILVIY